MGNLPSKTSRFWRLRTRKKFDSVPDLSILRKISDDVRRRSFIWEIPDKGMLKDGGMAVSLDYDSAWSSSAMNECGKFCSDDVGRMLATKEHGVYFGRIPQSIHADVGELACGKKPGRESDREKIFCMNMGIAVDYMVTASVVYQRAVETGAGLRLPL